MRKSALIHGIALILTSACIHAQIPSSANIAKERYLQRIASAEKIKNEETEKIASAYNAEVNLAQDEVRRTFEPMIRTAAMRNQTEEVRVLTLQLESILNPEGVDLSAQDSESPNENDYKQLIGKWETESSHAGYSRVFEFKLPRTAFYTYNYSTSAGGKGSQTEEWRASIKTDKIILERKDRRNFSRSYKEWYEIKIPFSTVSLEITRYHESDGRSSHESFILQRKL